MANIRYFILIAGWVAWMLPFFLAKSPGKAQQVDRRARWGVVLQGLGYAVIWAGPFRMHVAPDWSVGFSIPIFALGAVTAWRARSALGRHWRIEAGLSADHELVRTGPYEKVRHPIYASMLCMIIATGCALGPLWRLAVALPFFILGVELRVRVEDALLLARFGEKARSYQQSVRAYIPGIR